MASTSAISLSRSLPDPNDKKKKLSLWFHDGTLVIQAGPVGFRVYGGLLSSKSPVFGDMFALPQPSSSEEVYEGCPLVCLPDDPLDVYYFLLALHDSSAFFESAAGKRFNAMAALLRLGTKYEVYSLRRKALDWVLSSYPITSFNLDLNWNRSIKTSLDFEVLRLLREANVRTGILASVLYHCAAFHTTSEIATSAVLNAQDKILLLQGQAKLVNSRLDLLRAAVMPSSAELGVENCACPERCDRNRLGKTRSMIGDTGASAHPMEAARSTVVINRSQKLAMLAGPDGVCDHCGIKMFSVYDSHRRAFWDRMPSMFGLPPWRELVDEFVVREQIGSRSVSPIGSP